MCEHVRTGLSKQPQCIKELGAWDAEPADAEHADVEPAEGKHAELVNGVYRRQRGSEPFPTYAKEGSHGLPATSAIAVQQVRERACWAAANVRDASRQPPVALLSSRFLCGREGGREC